MAAAPQPPPFPTHANLRLRAEHLASSRFFEDFDEQPVTVEAAPPVEAAPSFSEAELVAACDACRNEGLRQGLEQAEAEQSEAQRRTLQSIAAALGEASAIAREAADARACDVARLLLATLAALFPELCARFGAAEAAAVARALHPALRHEPGACLRVHPDTATELAALLQALDPELCAMLRLVPTEAVAPGDMRIEWQNGAAVRNGAALWRAAARVLGPLDLLAPPSLPALAEPEPPLPGAADQPEVAAPLAAMAE